VVIPLAHEASQPLTDPFFVEMLGYLADAITQRGFGVLLQKIVPPMGDWLPALVASGRSDGVIVIGQSTEHAVLEEVAQYYRPLVVWGAPAARQNYCTVGADNAGGARRAVEHLIRQGRRRILFFGDPTLPEIGLRYEGYLAALEAAAQPLEARQVVPAHLTADAAFTVMTEVLKRGASFDAIFAASDLIAISAIQAISAAGKTVPQDIAVVWFDDIALAAHSNPALTTVRQDLKLGARTIVDLMFRRLAGEDAPSVILPAELVIRESCGAR
jgi:DNA-binding LacI/PurR family transcriptional regulator